MNPYQHLCGASYQEASTDLQQDDNSQNSLSFAATHTHNKTYRNASVLVYTCYLGFVNIRVRQSVQDNTYIFSTFHNSLEIRNIKYQEGMIPDKLPPFFKLQNLPAMDLDVTENHYQNYIRNKCLVHINKILRKSNDTNYLDHLAFENRAKKEYPFLFTSTSSDSLLKYQRLLKEMLVLLSPCDVHFVTSEFMKFLEQKTPFKRLHRHKVHLSLCQVPQLDNAFFNGHLCIYGNGHRMFTPIVALDVIAHELGHGIVSSAGGLRYKGESGALNESFADIVGTSFEFYLYREFPHLQGQADFLIGEDCMAHARCLRDMKNPESCRQPSRYKGKYFINPKSNYDYGGVHINSGIINFCFSLLCEKLGLKSTLDLFLAVLSDLKPTASFNEFSLILRSKCTCNNMKTHVYQVLDTVRI